MMTRRTAFESRIEKKSFLKEMESSGKVADSMSVRLELMKKVEDGDITLEDAQSQLKKIKQNAKKQGLMTRSQALRKG